MSDHSDFSRRKLLLAGAGLGGLVASATLPNALGAANEQKAAGPKPSAQEVAQRIKLDPANEKALAPLFEPDGISRAVVERLASGASAAPQTIELGVKELTDHSGRSFGFALSATVKSNGVYGLTLNGQPFNVRRFSCSFDQIAWVAGVGWPLYTSRCPRNNFAPNMFFRDAFAHQIVPWVKGVGYGIGCNNPATYDFGAAGQLYVGVNDDQYGDNQGTFEFTVYNYS